MWTPGSTEFLNIKGNELQPLQLGPATAFARGIGVALKDTNALRGGTQWKRSLVAVEDEGPEKKTRRGRPPKKPPAVSGDEARPATTKPCLRTSKVVPTQILPRPATPPTSSAGSPRRKSSPRKNAKHIDQPRTAGSVDVPFLSRCTPLLVVKTLQEAKVGSVVPDSVLRLHDRLKGIPLGAIPKESRVFARNLIT